jgi:VanZ family protein
MTAEKPQLFRAWLPAISWALAIFVLSSLPGPALPPLPAVNADKLVHAAVFGLLSALASRALLRTTRLGSAAVVLLASLAAATYGASDEFHQRFVAGRSADWLDVLADAAGGLLGAVTFTSITASRRRRER